MFTRAIHNAQANRYSVKSISNDCEFLIIFKTQKYGHKFKKEKIKTLPMGICPYCETEIHLGNFFEKVLGKKFLGMQGSKIIFKGEIMQNGYQNEVKMYTCPNCNKILGFSEFKWARKSGM